MITYEDFEQVDIRLGRVIEVRDFPEARKPAFKLTIDLGPEIGIKKSSGQFVNAYTREELLGKLVMCVVNFPPRQVGPFRSEVLTLGFRNTAGTGYVLAVPDSANVEIGDPLS